MCKAAATTAAWCASMAEDAPPPADDLPILSCDLVGPAPDALDVVVNRFLNASTAR